MYNSGSVSTIRSTRSSGKQQKRELPRFSLRRLLCPSSLFPRRIRAGAGHSPSSETTATKEIYESATEREHVQRASVSWSTEIAECPICLQEFSVEYFPRLTTCNHLLCSDCFRQYLRMEISESRINIGCPMCSHSMHPNDILMILDDKSQIEKYETFMVRRVLAAHPDTRWCPAPDCCYAVIAAGCAKCPRIKCERPGCDTYFCYHCKAAWHPNQTCDQARTQTSSKVSSSSIEFVYTDVKQCPRCQEPVVKMNDGGCNQMHCTICGTQFCWLCMQEITELHYLSLSGCTLWGEKPWSRRKRVFWQLGMFLGAPVGIILAAGVAVPTIVIGTPMWVGWKLYIKNKLANKWKRRFYMVAGVTVSALLSPGIAVLVVAIGVPVLILFVYGWLCASFFQSGGRRVNTSVWHNDENDVMQERQAADLVSIAIPKSSK